MPSYQRPGVFVTEVTTAANADTGLTADSAAAFIGVANRGPTKPVLVKSWSDYTALFGDFANSTYLADAVYSFFQNGGAEAWVARVAKSDQVTATRTLNDTAGTPVPTLQIDAYSPGAWGNQVYVDVTAGYTTGRFNINVYYGGTAITNLVEQFQDLSMASTDPRYVVSVINGSSVYVKATDLASATAAPNNAPANQSATALATGADGTAPTASDFQTTGNLFNAINQPLVMNAPGVYDATTINNLITIAESSQKIFLVVDPQAGRSVSQISTWAATLTPTTWAATYYPWIVVNDPSKFVPGTKKTIPPGGAVVGQYLATDAAEGPFRSPAGVRARLSGAIDLEATLQPADYDTLNVGNPPVNAVKPVPGYGICLFGARTLQAQWANKYISTRRSLVYIEQALKNLTEQALFEPNDGRLWASLTSQINGLLSDFYQSGGLRGESPNEAWYVKCDSSNNTAASIQAGVVNVEVGVALHYPAEFIVIKIGQFEGGASVTNSLAE